MFTSDLTQIGHKGSVAHSPRTLNVAVLRRGHRLEVARWMQEYGMLLRPEVVGWPNGENGPDSKLRIVGGGLGQVGCHNI